MLSNRSVTIVFFALISAVVFLITAKRLDQPSWDTGGYDTDPLKAYASYRTSGTPNELETNKTAITTATVTVTAKYTEALEQVSTLTVTQIRTRTIAQTPTNAPSRAGSKLSGDEDGSQLRLSPASDPVCEGFPDTSKILLVMKTGATESYDRLPVQIMTMLKCLPDFLIFSDLDQTIGGYHVRDSLDNVLLEAQEGNSEFDLYRQQRECAVDQDSCSKIVEGADSAGWNLDKYKNIHMAEKSYRLRPNFDWYVFVDADTYVSWPNMAYALNQLDPTKERYFGVPTVIGDRLFAHGGSGYIVSRGLMKEFVGKNPGIANKYDAELRNHCCGDFMFAVALQETIDISVEGFWPLSNGEKPFTAHYGGNTWCHAVGMMHHMNSEEISSFWEFERRRYRTNKEPLIFREVYEEFVAHKIGDTREEWDNGSEDWFYIDAESDSHEWEDWRVDRAKKEEDKSETEKSAHVSWENCRAACFEHDECAQFTWHDECCAMHRTFRMGKPMKKESEEKMRTISGWNKDRIKEWIDKYGDCEGNAQWPDAVREALSPQEEEEEGEEEEKKEEKEEREEEEEEEEEKKENSSTLDDIDDAAEA